MKTTAATIPSTTTARGAREALRALASVCPADEGRPVRVLAEGAPGAVSAVLPDEAFALLLELLGQLAEGRAVRIVPVDAELTTHQAAELLSVSRPYVIGLIDAGKLPCRMVGTHRRIRFADLMAYKQQDDARRDAALADLTRQSEDLDLGY